MRVRALLRKRADLAAWFVVADAGVAAQLADLASLTLGVGLAFSLTEAPLGRGGSCVLLVGLKAQPTGALQRP